MESNHTTSSCLYVTLIIALLFFFTCLLTCGCETTSTQQISCDDYDPQKVKIEHIDEVRLPEYEKRHEASSTQQISSADYDEQKEMIERVSHWSKASGIWKKLQISF